MEPEYDARCERCTKVRSLRRPSHERCLYVMGGGGARNLEGRSNPTSREATAYLDRGAGSVLSPVFVEGFIPICSSIPVESGVPGE